MSNRCTVHKALPTINATQTPIKWLQSPATQVNPFRSNPFHSNPIQSGPVQTRPDQTKTNPLLHQVLRILSSLPPWRGVQSRGWTRAVRHCPSDDMSKAQRRGFRASRPTRTARRFQSSSLPVRSGVGVGRASGDRVHAGTAWRVRSSGRGSVGMRREESR